MFNRIAKIAYLSILLLGNALQAMDVSSKQKALDEALIRYAKMGKSSAKVNKLITDGANVNAIDANGDTVLIIAAAHNDIPLCELLINKGADVNKKTEYGWTPLMAAAQDGRERICELLIKKGADVNAVSDNGFTPLMAAVSTKRGSPAVVRLLLTNNANISAKTTEKGRTAFSYVTDRGNRIDPFAQIEICKLLIDAMIKPTDEELAPIITMLGIQKQARDLKSQGRDIIRLIGRETIQKIKHKKANLIRPQIESLENQELKQALLKYINNL